MVVSCGDFAKDPKKRNLPVLYVDNAKITEILDSLIKSDKLKEYYSDSLFYSITIRKLSDNFLFTFTSTKLLGFRNTEQGVFKFKNHLVVVCSGNFESIESFFSKTNSEYEVRFHQFNNRITTKGEVILELIEDDTYDIWGFVYKNNKFIINGEDQKIWGE
jgi:hypothetical protein